MLPPAKKKFFSTFTYRSIAKKINAEDGELNKRIQIIIIADTQTLWNSYMSPTDYEKFNFTRTVKWFIRCRSDRRGRGKFYKAAARV